MDFKVSKVLTKDLLQERSKYIKDGQLIFNKIVIDSGLPLNGSSIHFYFDNNLLASTRQYACPGSYTTFTFQLDEGSMKISLKDEDVCSSSKYEKLNKAAAEMIKELVFFRGVLNNE